MLNQNSCHAASSETIRIKTFAERDTALATGALSDRTFLDSNQLDTHVAFNEWLQVSFANGYEAEEIAESVGVLFAKLVTTLSENCSKQEAQNLINTVFAEIQKLQ